MAQAILQSSLVGELEVHVEIKAPAKKFYEMLAVRPHDLPKATPGNIQGCELHEGEFGKVGCVIFWNYVVDGEPMVAKERIEAMDLEKNLVVFRVLEGEPMKEFKSLLTTIQATPKQIGTGSVVKWHMKYERIDEKVAHPEDLLTAYIKISKDMDEMLLSQV